MGEILNYRFGFDSGVNVLVCSDLIYIVIVDDYELFLFGIGGLIRQMDLCFVVVGYVWGSDFIESLKMGFFKFDLLIIDFMMKQVNGFVFVVVVRQLFLLLLIIMVFGVEDVFFGQNLIMFGINGFVVKSVSELILRVVIMLVFELMDKGFGCQVKWLIEQLILFDFVFWQRQIVLLVVFGVINCEILEVLNISENIVKFYLKDVFVEFGVISCIVVVCCVWEFGFL